MRGNRGKRGIRRYGGNRRFRKRGGLWLPTLGSNWNNGEETYYDRTLNWTSGQVFPELSSGPQQEVFALIPDFTFLPSEGSANRAASLHDRAVGNEWFLDAIVGRCFVNVHEGDEGQGEWPYVKVSCGIFVARAEEGDDATPDLYSDELDPLNRNNVQNPWVWTKTWLLGNPGGGAVLRDDFPISNSPYSSSLMSPEVIIKSKRRIRREHRLWFTYSVMGWDGVRPDYGGTQPQPYIKGCLEYRVFGRIINNPKAASSF